ncbi:MAG: PEP-CTERM sorting domain-containing protein [Verrucomicrobia bacterium]|nr:PEP-CTERM sorting domain-containing protein [Verrucomicrobiota bacterium]
MSRRKLSKFSSRFYGSLSAACILWLGASTSSSQIFLHDEAVSGDLSDEFDVPDVFALPSGSSFLRMNLSSTDVDLFTVLLPVGQQLDSLIVRDYHSVLGNISFLGLQVGDQLSAPPSSNFADPIDYVIFGDWAIAEDILPLMVQTNPALELPLTNRSIAFWGNETGAASSFVLEFRTSTSPVPEPSSVGLLGLSVALSIVRRRRKG